MGSQSIHMEHKSMDFLFPDCPIPLHLSDNWAAIMATWQAKSRSDREREELRSLFFLGVLLLHNLLMYTNIAPAASNESTALAFLWGAACMFPLIISETGSLECFMMKRKRLELTWPRTTPRMCAEKIGKDGSGAIALRVRSLRDGSSPCHHLSTKRLRYPRESNHPD